MEVDAISQGLLTSTEHQHHRDMNLCVYCGGSGHHTDTCAKLPDSRCCTKPATVALVTPAATPTQENTQSEVS